MDIAVIGLGYVGLPMALALESAGHCVIGIDNDVEKLTLLSSRQSTLDANEPEIQERLTHADNLSFTNDLNAITRCEMVVICIPLDLKIQVRPNDDYEPETGVFLDALKEIGSRLIAGHIVSIETTIPPSLMEPIILELEEASGMTACDQFHLVHAPERIMPKYIWRNLHKLPRVIGGLCGECTTRAATVYKDISSHIRTDFKTAAMVKLTENAYRDVNIAFANEIAIICEQSGINAYEVQRIVSNIPSAGGVNPAKPMLKPGAGVGGYCLPKDPHLLMWQARQRSYPNRQLLIENARVTNIFMPFHMGALITEGIQKAKVPISRAVVLLLGYTYSRNSHDTRNSVCEIVKEYLMEEGVAEVRIHDPYVERFDVDIEDLLDNADCLGLITDHGMYARLSIDSAYTRMNTPLIVDGRGFVRFSAWKSRGFAVGGVGRRFDFTSYNPKT